MNSLVKITFGFAFFFQVFSGKAASINELLFEDYGQNISRLGGRQWEFDKASWKMNIEIRDTVNISSFSEMKASEAVKIMTPNENVLKEVEFAAVLFAPNEKDVSGASLENSRNERTASTINFMENIGAETKEQFSKKGLSLDLFLPELKMGNPGAP